MEDLLTATKTTVRADQKTIEPVQQAAAAKSSPPRSISSQDDALESLRAEPDYPTLSTVLRYLNPAGKNVSSFNIKAPGPKAAQIINELVGTILPTFWRGLNEKHAGTKSKRKAVLIYSEERKLLLQCLSSVTGLGAIVARLRSLTASSDGTTTNPSAVDGSSNVSDLLCVLTDIIHQDDFLHVTWIDISNLVASQAQRTMLWKEFMSLIASSKVLSSSAEANDVLKKSSLQIGGDYWIGNGTAYAAWLGRNIAIMASRLEGDQEEAWKSLAQLFGRTLSLGYVGMYRCML